MPTKRTETKPLAYCNPMWADVIRFRLPEWEWLTDVRVPVAHRLDADGRLRYIFTMPTMKTGGVRKCGESDELHST